MKKLFKVIGWSFIWLTSFWSFLVITFPADAAKVWVADRFGKRLNAEVSIEEVSMRWNFCLRLKGISIIRGQGSVVSGQEGTAQLPPEDVRDGIAIKVASLDIEPRLLSLIRLKTEIAFTGNPSSGGNFTGSYDPEGLSLSFKGVLFKDFAIATLPIPSTAMFSGSGRFKLVKGKGTIEIEVSGIPGGIQRTTAPGGEGPGLDGKLKITASLPGL